MANLIMAMRFLGIHADTLHWNADIKTVLEELQPTLLITSGHESYLDRIDWEAVTRYRTAGRLLVGVAAPADEETQREWVDSLLHWSQEHPVDFFYNWTPPEYGRDRRYDRYRDAGYPVFTIEFGANPLAYRPIPDIERDLDYVFLGSFHGEKMDRYVSHFGPILNRHPGFLLGPGWPTGMTTIPRPTHSFLYARARVGINVHIPNLLKEPRTLDERVFNLAAAEVPLLVDNPALLTMRFSPDSFFIAENEKEFHELFEYILSDPAEARRRAQQARREVLQRFTLFHVIENVVKQLRTLL